MRLLICLIYIYFLYIGRAQFSQFLTLDCNFSNRTPFDNSVYYTDGVILYKYYCCY